jgi:phosphatidylserine/phosphatidylglycerophosphate/cardiolipin synthase-like enzyme
MSQRILRLSPVTGVRVDPILTALLLAELLHCSDELWLVSPWISDVPALDNSCGEFDAVIADASARPYGLSEALAMLAAAGARLNVVARPAEHNRTFLGRLRRNVDASSLAIVEHPDVHEKTFCGRNWLLTGSMNFTRRGMQVNDEAVTYRVDEAAAAQSRIELTHRWRQRS